MGLGGGERASGDDCACEWEMMMRRSGARGGIG